jgi:putative oxidoreductase
MASDRLVLRATVGGLMMGHGLQKLKGSFGGPGLEGTEQAMGAMGMHPAKHQALAAALSETIGGGLTAAGLLNPLGPAMITGVMAVAIKKVHLKNGVWVSGGGYEYNLTLMAAALALAAEGPGKLSLDGLFGKNRSGLKWAVVALALGLGSAAATLAISDRLAPAEVSTGSVVEPADEEVSPPEDA